MIIGFRKGTEKDTLICRRTDGSATWMTTSTFFTLHDLAHYAVETELNFRRGFYGLLAGGMNITDFEDKQKFRPQELPPESIHAELMVNLLLTEVRDGAEVPDFQSVLNEACRGAGLPEVLLRPQQVTQIRRNLHELIEKWRRLMPGEELELIFQ